MDKAIIYLYSYLIYKDSFNDFLYGWGLFMIFIIYI